ncbi:MAG TPA: spore coat U domain-containing protein [Allosphingosinicella sp.]|nr:spore coat U domain-containing protein [Allosphingosinicella sp.]
MQPASRRAILAAGLLAAPLALAPAGACTISSAGVAFGAYDPQIPGNDDSTGTVSVECHPSVSSPIVALSAGQSGTFAGRSMTSGSYTLTYNLYADSGRATIWGDGTSGTVTVTLTGGSVSGGQRRFSRTIYGRVPGSQNVGAGTYGDTITLTVTF